jgi:mannitol/fructose-specific phosphotransferase system IIA component (Ntr-type)
MKPVAEYTSTHYIKILKAKNKFKAIEELALVFQDSDVCSSVDELIEALRDREKIMSTGIGFGIAIPHARLKSVREMTFAIGISKKGIDFDSIDSQPAHLIILVAAGEKQHKEYLRLLSSIMTVLKKEKVKDRIINSEDNDEILSLLKSQ